MVEEGGGVLRVFVVVLVGGSRCGTGLRYVRVPEQRYAFSGQEINFEVLKVFAQ